MKTKFIIWAPVLLLFLASGCHSGKEPLRIFDYKYKKVLKETREEAYYYMARNFVPGSSIAVSVDGKLVWSEGIGQSSLDLEVPANRFTKYRMGDITQVLTALAYYQMVEKGKLNPADDMRKYLTDFPEKGFPIHLQNLIDQSSGIRAPNSEELNFRGINVNFQKAKESIAADTLLFPPGRFQYQSFYNYNLIGEVMEKASGEKFNKLISNLVTDTLGMKNTLHDNPFLTIKNRSNFFERNIIAQVVNSTTIDLRYRQPAQGYLSTAEDLVKLGNALLASKILSDSVKSRILRAPLVNNKYPCDWGNGLMMLQLRDGKPFYACRGNIKGSGAMLIIIPDKKIVLGWLANLDDEVEEMPGLKIAVMFRDFANGVFLTKEEQAKKEKKAQEEEKKKNESAKQGKQKEKK